MSYKLWLINIGAFIGFSCIGHCQSVDSNFIKKIDLGYTTRWDIENMLGKGVYLDSVHISPDNEPDIKKKAYIKSNELFYPDKGIIFYCASDGELISGTQFIRPYKGTFGLKDTIRVGKTTLGEAFPKFDTLHWSTTGASPYWSFGVGKYAFYVEKPEKDKNKTHWSLVPAVKDRRDFYKNQPIKIVDRFLHYDYIDTFPLYAPKNEKHINQFTYGWPKGVSVFMIPFYAMTGGSKSEIIKQGYWKEYSPKHLLIYEGTFKDGKKHGSFKYYDTNGKLIKTISYPEPLGILFYVFIVLGIALVLYTFIWFKNKPK